MCPIRAEISTHKHREKLFISYLYELADIGFRQIYFWTLPNFGDLRAKMLFFLYIINQNEMIL